MWRRQSWTAARSAWWERELVARELAEGRLIQLFDVGVAAGGDHAYHLAYPNPAPRRRRGGAARLDAGGIGAFRCLKSPRGARRRPCIITHGRPAHAADGRPSPASRKGTAVDRILSGIVDDPAQRQERRGLARPLLDMLGAITGLESTYLTSIDLQAGIQHVRYARNEGGMQIPEGMDVPWADTLCKRALDEGAPAPAMSRAAGRTRGRAQARHQTYVSAPVRADDGTLLGTLCGASASQQAVAPQARPCSSCSPPCSPISWNANCWSSNCARQCAAAVICAERSAHRPAQSPRHLRRAGTPAGAARCARAAASWSA